MKNSPVVAVFKVYSWCCIELVLLSDGLLLELNLMTTRGPQDAPKPETLRVSDCPCFAIYDFLN